jgi:hypothetical protein
MAGATQAAIAAAQINQNAMTDVSRMVSSSLDRAAKERAMQVDIMQNMVGAAQDFKKQEMDNFFKAKELDIRGRQLELEGKYKNIGYGLDEIKTRIAQQNADTEQKRVNAAIEQQNKGEANKDYLNVLGKEVVDKENKLKQDKAVYESEIESLTSKFYGRKESVKGPAMRGMSKLEQFKDKRDPNGIFNRLEKAKSAYPKALEEKQSEIERIRSEQKHIADGGTPGIYYPKINIPTPRPSNNTSGSNYSDQSGSVGTENETTIPFDSSNPLLPSISPPPNPYRPDLEGLSDDDKAAVIQIDEELKAATMPPEEDRREEVIEPQIFQAPMSEQEEQKIKDDYDKDIFSQILSPGTPLEDVPAFINELSPKGKQEASKKLNLTKSSFLLNMGNVRGFDPHEKYDTEKNPAYKAFSERMFRLGASFEDLVILEDESNEKLMEFRIAATKALAGTENESDDAIRLSTQKMYRAWVFSRDEEVNKNITNNLENEVRTGSGLGIPKPVIKSKSGNLDDFENVKLSFKEDPSIRIKKDEEAKLASYEKEFEQFYNDKKQFNKAQFFNVAKGSRLSSIITGRDGSSMPISDDPYVSEAPERELYDKIKNMSQVEAKRYWMEYKNFKPKMVEILPTLRKMFNSENQYQ